MKDLGTLGGSRSVAYSINNRGQVVGESYTANGVDYHAFVYSDGTMMDLNDLIPVNSGWVLTTATGINDRGEIVGDGYFDFDGDGVRDIGERRGFVLTPIH